jgi:hypothetical protein
VRRVSGFGVNCDSNPRTGGGPPPLPVTRSRREVADVEERIGVRGFLDDLRTQLKEGSFQPLPVRERKNETKKQECTSQLIGYGVP